MIGFYESSPSLMIPKFNIRDKFLKLAATICRRCILRNSADDSDTTHQIRLALPQRFLSLINFENYMAMDLRHVRFAIAAGN